MRILDASRKLGAPSLLGTPTGLASAGVWLVALVIMEVFGRQSTSDVGDALGVLGLTMLVLITLIWHREVGLGWVRSFLSAANRIVESLMDRQASIGIDFRAGTLDPFGYPRLLRVLLFATVSLAAIGCFWNGVPMADLRGFLAGRFFVGYLFVLTVLWGALLFLIMTTLLLFCMLVHDAFVANSLDPTNRSLRGEALTLALSAGALGLAGFFLDPSVALAVSFALLAALLITAILPVTHPVKMVWKSRATGGELRGVSVRWLSAMEGIQLVMGVTAFSFLALGNITLNGTGPVSTTIPITDILGRVLAWTGALGGGAYLSFVLAMLWLGFRLDPRRPSRPSLHVTGIDSRDERRRVQRMYQAIGWDVRFDPAPPRRADVCIQLVEEAVPETFGPTRWPLRVTREEVGRRVVLERMLRRDRVQKRRRLVKGLGRLFKIVAGRKFERGEGFWIGVHHWFVLGLSRDESEEDFDRYRDTWMRQHIGPSFSRCIDWPARQHLHHVLWCLDVDLIFLEDGVGFRGFEKVLRILFELYDTYGSSQRLEERMLRGIPKVRAIIQEVGLENEFSSDTYPEPDYEDIGRARVLHIFKDRGGDVDLVETPADRDRVPVLSH